MRYGFGRGLLIVLLAAGAVLGFSLAFARHWGFHHGYGHYGWGRHGYASFEDRAADACVRAAERVLKERGAPEAKAPTVPAPAPAPAAAP